MDKFTDTIEDLFLMVQEAEEAPPWALCLKLSEEVGEFSEVLLHDLGYLHHKEKEWEPLMEEAADIINVVIGVLAKRYPDEHPMDLTDDLLYAIRKKGNKYARIMDLEERFK